jgi:hypothetical protein
MGVEGEQSLVLLQKTYVMGRPLDLEVRRRLMP